MKKFLKICKPVLYFCLCVIICSAVVITVNVKKARSETNKNDCVLRIWQIDSFEGGKGSRADYLKKIGNEFSKTANSYITVTSISLQAAKMNFEEGNCPDLISYGAGVCGLEKYIKDYKIWCYGGYCLISLDENADFCDLTYENTIINGGKDNRADVTAALLGLQDAKIEKPTSAYLQLINGKYKYLLGSQRDIYRMRAREVNFKVKEITVFNDLYQNISAVINKENEVLARRFIDYLCSESKNVKSLGLFALGQKLYDDELGKLEQLSYDYSIKSPISLDTKTKIDEALSARDINILKNIMK